MTREKIIYPDANHKLGKTMVYLKEGSTALAYKDEDLEVPFSAEELASAFAGDGMLIKTSIDIDDVPTEFLLPTKCFIKQDEQVTYIVDWPSVVDDQLEFDILMFTNTELT